MTTETYSTLQNGLVRGKSSSQNPLMSKVVLLIGSDVGLLHSLSAAFAASGSDIALVVPSLSVDGISNIRERVQAYGSRFFIAYNGLQNAQTINAVISEVKKDLGGMDIVIDMSAYRKKTLEGERSQGSPESQWRLTKAILQELN